MRDLIHACSSTVTLRVEDITGVARILSTSKGFWSLGEKSDRGGRRVCCPFQNPKMKESVLNLGLPGFPPPIYKLLDSLFRLAHQLRDTTVCF